MIVRADVFVRDRRFWTVQNFFHAQRARLYAVYAQFVRSLDVEGAWYVRVLSVFRQCLCVRNWLLASTSLTKHLQKTHISLTKHAQSTYVPLTITFKKVLNIRNCIGFGLVRCCAWNVRSLSVIVSDTCAVYTLFIGDSDHAQPRKMTNFSTNNHAQTNFMRDLCVIGNGTGP